MPAKPAANGKPPGLIVVEPTVATQDAELAAAGRELAEDLDASRPDEFSSPAARRAAERTARRRQQADGRDVSSRPRAREPKSHVVTRAAASMLHGSPVAALIALIAGGVLGALLDALSAGGWVIGLLAAALTVIVLRVSGSRSGSTRGR